MAEVNKHELRSPMSSEDAIISLVQTGFAQMQAGRHAEAESIGRQVLALVPDHADSLHLMGLLSLHRKRSDEAVQWLSRAIRRDPRPLYLTSLGTALLAEGCHDEALQVFDKAVQLEPDDAELWKNLGLALAEAQRTADAVLAFQHALKLDPDHWDAAHRCGILLHDLGRIEESLSYLALCDTLRPNHVPTLRIRAASLHDLKRFEEALALCRQAHALEPGNAEICNQLGIVLRSLRQDEEALHWFEQALALRSDFRDALYNEAEALTKLHRLDEALALYECLKIADPNDPAPDVGIAHLHLLMGNFEAGWAGRETRWKIAKNYPKFQEPIWLGEESLDGKTILIVPDEGLGDTIQFVRYVPMLERLGARVVLIVQDSLHPLLSNLSGVAECIPTSATHRLPAFDFHCPIMSLPLAFGTRLETIPAFRSYLPALQQDRVQVWAERLGAHDRLRVGLVWSGNPKHPDDHNRSIPLQAFRDLLELGATFLSLQKQPRPDDKIVLQKLTGIVDLTGHLTDFVETAALLSCLDLVITVDTSVAHLAGALGCPTWTLLPYTPDYRWLLDREDSPWYPTMRLFRQTKTRDWREVLARVRSELAEKIASFRRRGAGV